jgi:hypothetical protein
MSCGPSHVLIKIPSIANQNKNYSVDGYLHVIQSKLLPHTILDGLDHSPSIRLRHDHYKVSVMRHRILLCPPTMDSPSDLLHARQIPRGYQGVHIRERRRPRALAQLCAIKVIRIEVDANLNPAQRVSLRQHAELVDYPWQVTMCVGQANGQGLQVNTVREGPVSCVKV